MITEVSNRELFEEYLKKTRRFSNANEQMLKIYVDYVEKDLLSFLQKNSISTHKTIYEYINKEDLNRLMTELLPNHSMSSANTDSGGKLRDSLNYLIGYINSKYHPLSEKQKHNKKKNRKEPASRETTHDIESMPVISEPEPYDKLEGKKHEASVTRYERDRGNRKACIAHYGYVCQVCGMNFEQVYGELGKDYIEVHHLHPVSQGQRKVDPIKDLIPLCSNCHSMIHRQEDVSDWKGLRDKFLTYKAKRNDNQ